MKFWIFSCNPTARLLDSSSLAGRIVSGIQPEKEAVPQLAKRNFGFLCRLALFAALVCLSSSANAQAVTLTPRDYSIAVGATTSSVSPYLTLNWTNSRSVPVVSVNQQWLWRRVKGSNDWGAQITVPVSTTSFTEAEAQPGAVYEYTMQVNWTYLNNGVNYVCNSFNDIVAGYNVPIVENRGKVILLVDNTMSGPLAPELETLQKNLVADGWIIHRHDVPRETISASSTTASDFPLRLAEVRNIRSIVQTDYKSDPGATWALLIIGRVPIPYSGVINTDGHSDHTGAYPADSYYVTSGDADAYAGDPDGGWTDTSMTNTTAQDKRNWNIPGDGKFDQANIPGDVKIQTGRVDLSNMPDVPAGMSETELLRQYLVRNDRFRRAAAPFDNIARRGIVDNNFSPASYASSGWRTGFSWFGSNPGQMDELDWFTTLQTTPMLFAYGCGPGSWQDAGGVGGSYNDFGWKDSKAVFNMLFGSYFADWDYSRNPFLKAPLAGTSNSLGLASMWSGGVKYYLYHMGVGETLGYGVLWTQNGSYVANGSRPAYLNLLGDPTLRLHSVAPPTQVKAAFTSGSISLSWLPSVDPQVVGYQVYRSLSKDGPFTRISGGPATGTNPTGSALAGTTFIDTDAGLVFDSNYTYMVRAVKMEASPSGTYANQSLGESVTVAYSVENIPNAPTALTATGIGTGSYLLSWQDNSGIETGYQVERRGSTTGTWTQLATLPENTSNYTDNTAAAGQISIYRIRAAGSNGNSDYSNTADDPSNPGLFRGDAFSYITTKTSGTASVFSTRANGSQGGVGVAYGTSNVLGTAGTDYVATSSTVNWAHGETGSKAATVPILNPTGTQLTKIFKITYSNPTNGLATSIPNPGNGESYAGLLTPHVFVTDPAAQVLPSPWSTTTMGTIIDGVAGYAEHLSGTYGLAVKSAGFADGWSSDNGRFLYQSVTGDFTFTARIPYQTTELSNGGVASGVMIRNTTAANSNAMDSLFISGPHVMRASRIKANVPTYSGGTYPYWLRIKRSGNSTSVFRSSDGTSWTQVGTTTTQAFTSTALVGLFLSSNTSQGSMCYAQYDNLSLYIPPFQPSPITWMTAVPGAGSGRINLSWASSGTGVFNYAIERSTNAETGFKPIATVAAPASGYTDTDRKAGQVYHYRVKAATADTQSDYSPTASTAPSLASGIAGWRYLYFGLEGATAGLSDNDSDPDQDSIGNFTEYAFGTDPTIPDSPSALKPVAEVRDIDVGQRLTFSFTRFALADDLNYVVETTGDLAAWSQLDPLDPANQVEVLGDHPRPGTETIRVKDSQPLGPNGRRFMRLRIFPAE